MREEWLQVAQSRDLTMPSSLVQQIADGEARISTNACLSQEDELNPMEQLRCASISVFQWLDSHAGSLNARSRPPNLVSLAPGTQVYFHKLQGLHRRLQDNATGQHGPAIVAATEGVDKVWVRYRASRVV